MGDRREPTLTAIISSIINFPVSFLIISERLKVSGTTIRILISFVRNMEKTADIETSKKARLLSYRTLFTILLETE